MLGKFSGVMTRLRDYFLIMIVNHCAAHKVNLAVQDVIQNDLAFKTIVDIFKDIHSYYNESKKIVQLKETCSKLKMTYQKVKKPSATRWLYPRHSQFSTKCSPLSLKTYQNIKKKVPQTF